MKKNLLPIVLAFMLVFCLSPFAAAASPAADTAAANLHSLGLFQGVGANADGSPNFDLDRPMNRQEGITMLVRLLGKEQAAVSGAWQSPFTDVDVWAKPYVNYAYANGLTQGTGTTTFGGNATVSAAQYMTFVLRALGYSSDTDFTWNSPFGLTDSLGLTAGQFPAQAFFFRADAALASNNALGAKLKGSDKSLLDTLVKDGAVKEDDRKDEEKDDKEEVDEGKVDPSTPNISRNGVVPKGTFYPDFYQDGSDIYEAYITFFLFAVNGVEDYYILSNQVELFLPIALDIYESEKTGNQHITGYIGPPRYYFNHIDEYTIEKDGLTIKKEVFYPSIDSSLQELYRTFEYNNKSFTFHDHSERQDTKVIQDGVTFITFSAESASKTTTAIGNKVFDYELYINANELMELFNINKTIELSTLIKNNDCFSF